MHTEATRVKDEESRRELEEETRFLKLKLDRMKRDAENLDSVYQEQKAMQQRHVKSLSDQTKRVETVQTQDRGLGSSNRLQLSLQSSCQEDLDERRACALGAVANEGSLYGDTPEEPVGYTKAGELLEAVATRIVSLGAAAKKKLEHIF